MEEETFTDYLLRMKRERRNLNEYKSELNQTNSDTLFEIKRQREKRQLSQDDIRIKDQNPYNIVLKHNIIQNVNIVIALKE